MGCLECLNEGAAIPLSTGTLVVRLTRPCPLTNMRACSEVPPRCGRHGESSCPLVCPSCGGEMRIIAFIIDHDVVDAILRHLAKAEARSPRGSPGATALSVAS